MLKRFYTVMVVPHEGGNLARMNVSLRFIVTMSLVFLLCYVSTTVMSLVFLQGWNEVDDSEQYRSAAERVELENTLVHSSLYRTVVSLDALTARLEELGEVNSWEAEPGEGDPQRGGLLIEDPNDPSSHALESDWRGMAASAQEKADYWSTLLERRICDRASVLRALPTVWPVHGRLSSGYQYRKDPFTGARTFHRGIDIAAPRGTPVLAAGDAIVIKAGRNSGYGNSIVLDHGNGLQTLYAHLSRMHVKVGDVISRADAIGEVGSTGRSRGPHLHFEIIEDGNRVNPLKHYLTKPRKLGRGA